MYVVVDFSQCIDCDVCSIENGPRVLSEFGIASGTRLKCDDFLQEFNIVVNIYHVYDYLSLDTYLLVSPLISDL